MTSERPTPIAGNIHVGDVIESHDSEKSSALEIPDAYPPQTTKPIDMPPDGGYGWVCVASVFVINFHTWGLNSSYGVFLSHYLTFDTYPGATSLEYAFVGGLSISTALLTSPISTIVCRRYGTQVALSIGIVFETAGLLGASWATRIWQLFLSQGVSFGVGMGFLFIASVGVIPQWFSKKRSFANSIGTSGSGIGGLAYSLAVNRIIQTLGLDWAFRILAIVSCVMNVLATIVIRDRNKAVEAIQNAFHLPLLKQVEFLLLVGWGIFSELGYVVLLFSLVNYARSVGLTATQGSVVGAMLNLGQGIGRPFIGYFSDAAGRINIAGGCTFLAGLFCLLIWIFAKSYGVLIFFALTGGAVAGTFWTVIGPVGAEVVGVALLPSALSMTWVILVLPTSFSEPIGLQLRRSSGNIYLDAQLFAGFMYLGGATCVLFLRAWKIAEIERQAAVSREQREQEIRDNDAVKNDVPSVRRQMSRTASVKTATKGLWSWQRV
ncbi:MFS transporter-like protein [Calycina marina]|uniref:MFS transporter-like protein n=1 Tax=Calycina marina TaxID=1763456 RepID=A0A9P7ZBC4_9HELO|nr:MFS transporter-like protein [Calycina marina]